MTKARPVRPGDVSLAETLAALFAYLPPPAGQSRWTGEWICAQTRDRGVVGGISAAALSLMRSGRLCTPSWWIVTTLAGVFGVDVEVFTLGFHYDRQDEPMRERVLWARLSHPRYAYLASLAAEIMALPDPLRATVVERLDLLDTSVLLGHDMC